jgi:hypothetical protein
VSGNRVILLLIFAVALVDWLRARLKRGGSSAQPVYIVDPPKPGLMKRLRKQARDAIVGGGILWFVVVGIAHASHSHHAH